MIDCKKIAEEIKDELKEEIKLVNTSTQPVLAIVQVGDNEASNRYVKGKMADCKDVGIKAVLHKVEADYTEEELLALIDILNKSAYIHGIIVQLPLPKHLNEERILQSIEPRKDVDGFTRDSMFTPCTPLGVLTLLEKMGVDVKGKLVTLVGYGKLVNKPLFPILSDMGATVAVCRSNTAYEDLDMLCYHSDVVISAVGKHGTIKPWAVSCGCLYIDCGIQVIDGKQYGDCSLGVYNHTENVTPRIGGMGLMTRAALMMNVVKAWKEQI
jgi:methylenetetrahydrofolate dehydrogenase (NADP+)/methenyltetrahydrofolate cyclohydrolase